MRERSRNDVAMFPVLGTRLRFGHGSSEYYELLKKALKKREGGKGYTFEGIYPLLLKRAIEYFEKGSLRFEPGKELDADELFEEMEDLYMDYHMGDAEADRGRLRTVWREDMKLDMY